MFNTILAVLFWIHCNVLRLNSGSGINNFCRHSEQNKEKSESNPAPKLCMKVNILSQESRQHFVLDTHITLPVLINCKQSIVHGNVKN